MQTQQMVPRRPMRNRPYDLRKRVLLKNFLRAQNANQNFSIFNLAQMNAVPTYTEQNGIAERDEKEPEEIDNSESQGESCENVIPGSELLTDSLGSSSQNFSDEVRDISVEEISSKTVNDQKLLGTYGKNDSNTKFQEVHHTEMDSPQTAPDTKHNCGPKSSVQSKLTIKKPYTFCHRKSLRDPTKKKVRSGITKAKHSYKAPKSPSKRKFNVRSAFSQIFSRKGNSCIIEDVAYDTRDRRESGNFFAKLFKQKNAKPQSKRNSSGSASLDSQAGPDFPTTEYNLRSVSRSVQTDFSMCCHDFMFDRSAANHFACENRYCGPEGSTVVNGDRSQQKLSHSNKRRRYSDSSALCSSSSFMQQNYTDSSSIPKTLHNSLYTSDRYNQNEMHSPRHVTRSRSLTEWPNNVESLPLRCQRSKSVRFPNLAVAYSFRSECNQHGDFSKAVASSRSLVTRNKDIFSEHLLNQRYGLDVQHRPSLLPNPPKQASASVFRSSSVRETSKNSPLLRKNPILCRRTRSVSERFNQDRMASYYK